MGRALVTGAASLAAVAAAGAAWGQLQQAGSVSVQRTADGWRPALFVCDGTDRDRVYVMSAPDRQRRARLTTLAKPGMEARETGVVVGRGDAGMSQVRYALADEEGRVIGNVHAVSPAVVEPGATTPSITSVTVNRETTGCRFVPQVRVLGVTAKRSVQVTATERNGYRYRSYDHDTNLPEIGQPWGGRDTRASLTIEGGRLVDQRGARRVYEFSRGGYVYRVMASVDAARGGGGVQVLRDGRVLLSEAFGAYTAATRP